MFAMSRKVVPRGSWFSYALRQLKSPISNINRLDKHCFVSTGTFVTQGVIHTWDSWVGWRSRVG